MPPENNTTNANADPIAETEIVRVPDFKSYYTNFVQAGLSPFDISLEIGEAEGYNPQTNKWLVLIKAKITMAPNEAKLVVAILANAVRNFESQYGQIPSSRSIADAEADGMSYKTEGE